VHIRSTCVLAIVLVCGSAMGQERPKPTPIGPSAPAQPVASDPAARRERLVRATELPAKAREVRAKGVPDGEMKDALRAAKSKGVKAGDMADVTGEQSKAIDQHGRIDNFGSFVRSKLDEGLRGRELAAAIHEEHARRGMGKANAKGKGAGGKSEESAKPPAREKPAKPPDLARPHGKADKGRPADGGQPKGGGGGKGRGKP
jgi:hypothetical protein